jgi:tetratricopeptide (TPR) repeat protein
MRGDLVEAEKALLKALSMRFDDIGARELAADILYDRGEFEKAAKHYKSLYTTQRPRPSAESGYARCVLKVAEIAQQREALLHPMDAPTALVPERRTPIVAAMLSSAPGLGQVYCGQFIKGVLLFTGWLFFLLLIYISQPRNIGSLANARPVFSQAGIAFICIAIFIHAYALVDAVMTAEKTVKRTADKK